MSTVAYRRASTTDQRTDRQLPDEKFDKDYEDKASAKDLDRPKLTKLIEYVREGDTVVHSIGRLARNPADLKSLIQTLNEKGVIVEFREEQLTFSGGSDAMRTLMLLMKGALAQFERSMIRERQRHTAPSARTPGSRPPTRGATPTARLKQLK